MPNIEPVPSKETALIPVFMTTHEELWGKLDPAVVRLAIARASEIAKEKGEVAGQAFLAGIAIGQAAELIIQAHDAGELPTIEDEWAQLDQAS